MPSMRISKSNNSGWYFITFTILRWYYLFDRHSRWNILAESLKYCIEHKKLELYGFVFMLNHIHLVFESTDASGFVRDFKKFTSKALKQNIQRTEPNILQLFVNAEDVYHFWQPTNMPLLIESERFLLQKIEYIHNNPVRKGYVLLPHHWYWSSANPQCELKTASIG